MINDKPNKKIDIKLAERVNRIIFSNKYRMVAYSLVTNPENKDILTISNIHKWLCDFYGEHTDYKNIYKHIKILEKEGFVKIRTQKHTQGSCSFVSLKNKRAPEIFDRIIDVVSPSICSYKLSEDERKEELLRLGKVII